MTFRPLHTERKPDIEAVFFDFDGTLTLPGALDFPAIKKELGCPQDQPVLEYVQRLANRQRRREAMSRLETYELMAAENAVPNQDAVEILTWIHAEQLPLGILTRNSLASVTRALKNFPDGVSGHFDLVISRDDAVAPKPSGDGLTWAARQLGLSPERMMMVGDFVFDCQAGRAAGCCTVLLDPTGAPHLAGVDCDYRIERLAELKTLIKKNGR